MRGIVWDDFSVGEFGVTDPRQAPKGSWTGENVLRYADGSVGPRSGFFKRSTINDAAATLKVLVVATSRRQVPDDTERDIFVGLVSGAADKVYGYNSRDDADKGFLTGTPDFTVAETEHLTFVRAAQTNDRRLYIGGADLNRVDDTTVTEVTAPPISVASLCQYGERLVGGWGVANTLPPANANRIHFSNAAAFETWDALDFIDVGADAYATVDIVPQRSHLVVSKRDGSWWVITGTLGSSETLRRVLTGEARSTLRRAVGLANGEIWFLSGQYHCPVLFDGSQLVALRHLRVFTAGDLVTSGATFDHPGDLVWLCSVGTGTDERKLLVRRNNAWSIHTENTTAVLERIGTLAGDLLVAVGEESTSDVDVPIFLAELGLDRPPFRNGATDAERWEDDRDDAAASMFDTSFTLPEFYAEDGSELLCRAVAVDFKKYTTGSTFTNHFDVSVTATGRYDAAEETTATQSFDEANAGGTTGTRESRTFFFGDQGTGRGFQVTLASLRGVAIRSVTAYFETQKPRV